MKVLMQMDLAEELIEEIRQVAEEVEVVCVDSDAAALEVMPEIEVVCGHISREMFARRKKLKWMQSWGAGVDGVLHPELVESDVVLCSAKGWVGVHLAEHAMALLLGLTRGIHTAVRHPDWERRWRFALRRGNWLSRRWGLWDWGGRGGSWRSGRARLGCGLSRWIQKRSKCQKQWKPAGGWISSTRCWNKPTWWQFARR